MNQNKVIRNLADACLELDRLQVELCKETPYPIPDSEETRDRILEVMNYLEVLAKEVGLTDRKVKEVRKVHIVQDPYHFIDGVYARRKDANKVRDYLGAGHFVTEYEVKESIENNQ